MSTSNTAHSYGSVAKSFHWLTALLIITLIPLGIVANKLPYDTSEQLAQKAFLFSLHKTLGVTVFFVALARIAWALGQPKPGSLNPDRKAEHWLAETVHWLLYGSLLLVPLSGWIHHAATTGFAPIWWPFGQSLPFVPKSDDVAALFAGLHIVFERVLALSIFLHIAGALKHHFVDKDHTLKRMWFGSSDAPVVTPHHHSLAPIVTALAAWAVAIGIGSGLGIYTGHGSASTPAIELEKVQSDWSVEDGQIAIEVTQFGSQVSGDFADWTAQISLDPDIASGVAGQVEAVIAISSLTLGSVSDQAMGPDYFDAAAYPTATFKSDITVAPDGYEAAGTLTIRDVSVPVTLQFALIMDGDQATMFARTSLNRLDFGIGQNMPDESSLGFGVDVSVNVVARRGGDTATE